jgi:hypothetical protein
MCLLVLCACTTTRELQQPLGAAEIRELNESMRDRDVQLGYLRPGEVVYTDLDVSQVHIAPVATQFLVEGKPGEVPTLALHSLTFLSPGSPRMTGAVHGLIGGLGLVALGGIASLLIGATCPQTESCTGEIAVPLLIGGALGLVVAPALGAAIGHHDEVIINSRQ